MEVKRDAYAYYTIKDLFITDDVLVVPFESQISEDDCIPESYGFLSTEVQIIVNMLEILITSSEVEYGIKVSACHHCYDLMMNNCTTCEQTFDYGITKYLLKLAYVLYDRNPSLFMMKSKQLFPNFTEEKFVISYRFWPEFNCIRSRFEKLKF